ncbi:MAG: hypothetical protein ACI841_000360 [Planctomycetota bacterium]|jgi:hypothetical protein
MTDPKLPASIDSARRRIARSDKDPKRHLSAPLRLIQSQAQTRGEKGAWRFSDSDREREILPHWWGRAGGGSKVNRLAQTRRDVLELASVAAVDHESDDDQEAEEGEPGPEHPFIRRHQLRVLPAPGRSLLRGLLGLWSARASFERPSC